MLDARGLSPVLSAGNRQSRTICMAKNETRPTGASVEDYIASRANAQQRTDLHFRQLADRDRDTRPSSKGMMQTSVERTGRSQLCPGVGRAQTEDGSERCCRALLDGG